MRDNFDQETVGVRPQFRATHGAGRGLRSRSPKRPPTKSRPEAIAALRRAERLDPTLKDANGLRLTLEAEALEEKGIADSHVARARARERCPEPARQSGAGTLRTRRAQAVGKRAADRGGCDPGRRRRFDRLHSLAAPQTRRATETRRARTAALRQKPNLNRSPSQKPSRSLTPSPSPTPNPSLDPSSAGNRRSGLNGRGSVGHCCS